MPTSAQSGAVALNGSEPLSADLAAALALAAFPPLRRGRVLMVDDDTSVCKAIARLLSDQHDVTAVSSAELALDQIRDGTRFDVILCDLHMPQMTGMDLYGALTRLDA